MNVQTRTTYYAPCEERRSRICRGEIGGHLRIEVALLAESDGWVTLHTGKFVCPECLNEKARFMWGRA